MNERDAELLDRALDLAERGRRSASPNPRRRLRDRPRRPRAGRGLARATRRAARRARRARRLQRATAGRHRVRLARAVQPSRPSAALRRCPDRGRHRARRLRDRRSESRGRRARAGAPAGGGSRRRARRRASRGARAPPERPLPDARRAAPPVRAAQAGRDPGRAHRHEHRREPLDLLAREPPRSCTTGGRSSTPSPWAAGRRWPTTPSCCRATPSLRRSACRCASSSTAAARLRGRQPPGADRRRGTCRPRGPGRRPPPPAGVEALEAATLEDALAPLGAREITSLLVEGGAELAAGLLRADLVDALALFLAPRLIGGDGRPAARELWASSALADAPALLETSVREVGPDVLRGGPAAAAALSRCAA